MEREILDKKDRFNDLITTALRTSWGINIEEVKQQYGKAMTEHLLAQADKWLKSGHLKTADGCLQLTRKGIVISDSIMSELIEV